MTQTSEGFGLSRIGQIAVVVKDSGRATAFYRDVLGMKFLFSAPPNLAFFDCGGVRLMLTVPEKPEFDHPASIIYYVVADIQAAYETLSQLGVAFEDEPKRIHKTDAMELWIAAFRDSEGNMLALMCEVAKTEN